MKPRILISARLYGPAGIETHLLNLCRLLVREGAEVTLACRIARKDVPLVQLHRELGVHLVRTPFANNVRLFRASTAWAFAFWPRRLKSQSFDVLYSLDITRLTRFLSRFIKPEGFVLWNRIGNLASASEKIDQSLLNLLNGVIVETDPQAVAIRDAYSINAPVAAISHMAHSNSLPPRRENRNGALRLAFLGRYDRDKGIYRLLEVWRKLDIGKAELNFHGHGREHQRLVAAVETGDLSGSVQVNSSYSENDLGELLGNTDLVVLPSFSEGLPLVLLEAMAHGVPFVATDVGAVRLLAEENPDVLVVPNDDQAIKHGIETMTKLIRSGAIDGRRLQRYHARRYGYDSVSRIWSEALLNPERFWRQKTDR
jgi:glycosyltransferase involved in cell wall biosynthesis